MFRREAGEDLSELKSLISVKSMLSPGTSRRGSKKNTNSFLFSTYYHRGDYFSPLQSEDGRGRKGLCVLSLQLNAQQ